MTHIYILLNHSLTDRQTAELHKTYGDDAVLEYPSAEIKAFWSQVPTEPTLPQNEIDRIVQWLSHAKPDDVLIIQGEYGATFYLVSLALKRKMKALYAVTKRVNTETREGEKVLRSYVFEHVCFREYKLFEELLQ